MIVIKSLGPRQNVIIAVACSALAISFLSWWYRCGRDKTRKRKDRNCGVPLPLQWDLFGHLTAITLYPLKSGRGINLNEADATPLGLKSGLLRDRFFIVYDESGNFVTGRKFPKMVLITVIVTENGSYQFSASESKNLIIPPPEILNKQQSNKFKCRLWSDKVCGIDAGEEAAKWISQLLISKDYGLRIGCYMPEIGVERSVSPLNQVYKNLMPEDTGAYSDLSAFMLISEDSVTELNTHLDKIDEVTSAYFRPNFVVSSTNGGKPFAEDDWEWCRIGNEDGPVFRNVKPCTRCVFTTVNPENGTMNPRREPLAVLKTYRQLVDLEAKRLEGTAPVMGINLGLYSKGTLHLGDLVYVGTSLKNK